MKKIAQCVNCGGTQQVKVGQMGIIGRPTCNGCGAIVVLKKGDK